MWQPPKFDKWQFASKRAKAVSKESGLSFQDFSQCHIYRREVKRTRRLPTPEWAVNDAMLRDVLLKFAERRVYLHPDPALTNDQRLEHIRKKELSYIPSFRASLVRLYERHKNEPDHRARLQAEIENVDTQILLAQRGNCAVANAVVYYYHRCGMTSCEVATMLHIKPPHVRQILARLTYAASGVAYIVPVERRRREFRAFVKQLKETDKVFARVKRVVERKRLGPKKRWSRDRFLFLHFLVLKGTPWPSITKKLGISHPHSAMNAYRHFLRRPEKLAA